MSRPYQGRSPCGERGLKSSPRRLTPLTSASLPVRGAWIEIQVIVTPNAFCTSLPVRGAWIEINGACPKVGAIRSRSPCGERGLKYNIQSPMIIALCRSPCGERGLKWLILWITRLILRRSPCGERGLKYHRNSCGLCGSSSLPVRGAWIEMQPFLIHVEGRTSLPVRGAWIEIVAALGDALGISSLPVRGAWIEISSVSPMSNAPMVAPRAGSVD